MRGIGSLVFWTLLSLSAVVVNSYGQTPTATQSATATVTPFVSVAPPTMVPPTQVQRVMPPQFPAQAGGSAPQQMGGPSPIPTVLPKNYVPPTSGGH